VHGQGAAVLGRDLAAQTTDLVMLANTSEARALDRLVTVAARQVPACSGANAATWLDGELLLTASSHPDLAALTDVQRTSGRGPVPAAIAADQPVHCADTLLEDRWPEYAAAALRRGVRCSVTMVHQAGGTALTLALLGARPRSIDPDQMSLAELLVVVGGAVLSNVADYGESRRTALQLTDAAASRELVDQAKGVLMHAFSCSAADALQRLRQMSQQGNIKVTQVAARIIEANSGGSL
jgi:ANTAR domain